MLLILAGAAGLYLLIGVGFVVGAWTVDRESVEVSQGGAEWMGLQRPIYVPFAVAILWGPLLYWTARERWR